MAQEFVIKSQDIEDKINQLLPSQGGFQAGVDFSASTMVVPIVDLTETAEGSALRQDLQTSLSFNNTNHDISSTTTTIINTTGYFRIAGTCIIEAQSSGAGNHIAQWIINDGTTDKVLFEYLTFTNANLYQNVFPYDFIVFLKAGHSIKGFVNTSLGKLLGSSRQIADLAGNLIDP